MTIEGLDEGVYRLTGSFHATLLFQESAMAEPDPDRALEVVGTFVVERLSRIERSSPTPLERAGRG